MNVYNSFIHDSQSGVYPYNGILIHKKKQNADICYIMDKSQKYYVKLKKPDTKDHMLHDSTYMN